MDPEIQEIANSGGLLIDVEGRSSPPLTSADGPRDPGVSEVLEHLERIASSVGAAVAANEGEERSSLPEGAPLREAEASAEASGAADGLGMPRSTGIRRRLATGRVKAQEGGGHREEQGDEGGRANWRGP